jgi:hypothetical protein
MSDGALLALGMAKACKDWDVAGLKCPTAPEVSEITSSECLQCQPAGDFDSLGIHPSILVRERRAAIIGPTSSGTPGRPKAVIAETILLTSGLSRTIPPLKSVSTGPGATTLAVIRRGPSSLAR